MKRSNIILSVLAALTCIITLFSYPTKVWGDDWVEVDVTGGTINASELSGYSGKYIKLKSSENTIILELDTDLSLAAIELYGKNLTIEGRGTLTLSSSGNAITSVNDITIKSGTVISSSESSAGISLDGNLTMDSGSLTVTSETAEAIGTGNGKIIINGGTVKAYGNNANHTYHSEPENALYANEIIINGGTVEAYVGGENGIAILGRRNIEIKGGTVTAKGNTSAISTLKITGGRGLNVSDELPLYEPVRITIKEYTHGIYQYQYIGVFAEGSNEPAKYVVIGISPPKPSPDDKEKTCTGYFFNDRTYDTDDSDHTQENITPAKVHPDGINGSFSEGGTVIAGAVISKSAQGPAAQALFNATRPAGWQEAFTFNLTVPGRDDHSLKSGTLTIFIPAELIKQGRTFALIGIDKSGKAVIFNDTDNDPATFTTNLNIEGFAFALIYTDN